MKRLAFAGLFVYNNCVFTQKSIFPKYSQTLEGLNNK